MEVKEMTIADVLKTPAFYNNLKGLTKKRKTMKRIPRKLKKIAKNAISYGTNEFFNFYQNLPKNGVVFYIPGNIKKNKKGHHVVKFGKKVIEAYYNGLFDF